MSTAHRPTWAPAMGGEEQGGRRMRVQSKQQSAKDMPSQLTMKVRQPGQGTAEELEVRDFRAELEAKERKHFKLDKLEDFERERANDRKLLEAAGPAGISGRGLNPNARDADDVDADSSSESSSDDDSDDDMEALQAELEKIRAEKAQEKAKEAEAAAAKEEQEARDNLIRNNPQLRQELGLEDDEASFQVKRRWDDDVVFKNQARTEPKRQKRFINDTVRSDFHRRFLDRYVK